MSLIHIFIIGPCFFFVAALHVLAKFGEVPPFHEYQTHFANLVM